MVLRLVLSACATVLAYQSMSWQVDNFVLGCDRIVMQMLSDKIQGREFLNSTFGKQESVMQVKILYQRTDFPTIYWLPIK